MSELPDRPLDIVGDVHGERDALRNLCGRLGYDQDGHHREGRHLVFVGDLVDRGPDSPGVVRLVRDWIERGTASATLGNHELNLLRRLRRLGNAWFYGAEESNDQAETIDPQNRADESFRQEFDDFASRLPLALFSRSLVVVHACADQPSLHRASASELPLMEFYEQEQRRAEDLAGNFPVGSIARSVALQNENAVRTLVSGLEEPASAPYFSAGKIRDKRRSRWWLEETGTRLCVFGHYWRIPTPTDANELHVFDEEDPFAFNVPGKAICIDYSVGKRWLERRDGVSQGHRYELAALRYPELQLVTDQGRVASLAESAATS